MNEKTIVALEIGSSKIKGAVGVVCDDQTLSVQAIEESPVPRHFVRHGIINNVDEVSKIAQTLLRKLQNRFPNRRIESVYVGVGGRSFKSSVESAERRFHDDVEITNERIGQLIDEIRRSATGEDDVYEVLPCEYAVNDRREVRPVGTFGRSLKLSTTIVKARNQHRRNIDRVIVDKLGLKVNRLVVRQVAQADLVLSADEKRLGCMLVDFGAETTTVSIYKDGYLAYLATLPMGSRNITLDLAQNLSYLEEQAEEVKRNHCSAKRLAKGDVDHEFTLASTYVSHRAAEIIENIKAQIAFAGFTPEQLPGGIVIVGRGALLTGFNDRLSETIKLPFRLGNINVPHVRFQESRAAINDSIDIVAVLNAVRNSAADCLSPLAIDDAAAEDEASEQTETVSDPDNDDSIFEDDPDEITVATDKKNRGGSSLFKSLVTKVTKILSEDNEDDDIMSEDK